MRFTTLLLLCFLAFQLNAQTEYTLTTYTHENYVISYPEKWEITEGEYDRIHFKHPSEANLELSVVVRVVPPRFKLTDEIFYKDVVEETLIIRGVKAEEYLLGEQRIIKAVYDEENGAQTESHDFKIDDHVISIRLTASKDQFEAHQSILQSVIESFELKD